MLKKQSTTIMGVTVLTLLSATDQNDTGFYGWSKVKKEDLSEKHQKPLEEFK